MWEENSKMQSLEKPERNSGTNPWIYFSRNALNMNYCRKILRKVLEYWFPLYLWNHILRNSSWKIFKNKSWKVIIMQFWDKFAINQKKKSGGNLLSVPEWNFWEICGILYTKSSFGKKSRRSFDEIPKGIPGGILEMIVRRSSFHRDPGKNSKKKMWKIVV